ncbi:MAG: hypothetical protein WDN67_01290 [Candidatus Moraniibacteriota bacterium]
MFQSLFGFLPDIKLAENLTGDLSLILLFVGLSIGFGFVFGRTKLLSVMIDVYVARALVSVIPTDWIADAAYANVIIFSLVFIFLLLIDQRLFDIHLSNRGSDFFWRLGVMSLLVTGMVLSSFLFFFPQEVALDYLSHTVYGYFTNPFPSVFWMLGPLFVLFFINKRLMR